LLVKDNDVPPAIVPAELHKVRVQLADTQRENRQLQRQLAQAQQRQAESVGLQEKCNLLQKRLQNLADQHAKLNAQYEESRAVTNAWKELGTKLPSMLCSSNSSSSAAAASSLAGPPEAVAILRYFENAELEIQLAQEQAQMYKTELEAWRKQKEQAGTSAVVDGDDNSVESLQQQVRDYQIQQEKIQNQLILAQQQSSLYQRETESLRALIKTFEYQIETKQPVQLADATLHVRVDTIQQELANLQNAYDTVLKELEVVRTEKSKQGVELDRVREKFVKIREALENEKVKATKAQERAVLAEQLAGKGSFDPQRTRVMHFTETPLVMALKEEISVLKRQLELAANSQQQALTGGSLAPDAEKLNQRLKETFRDQIATFREGVYLMTGFKIDMLSGTERPTFRLRSVFAEREQDHLVLQYPTTTADRKVSSLDILQTDFARILTTEPSYDYVRKFHSIPAFLSSVQLSLFEKQTVML
jgi:mitotic spindle assembly checkpoint protein MAD1